MSDTPRHHLNQEPADFAAAVELLRLARNEPRRCHPGKEENMSNDILNVRAFYWHLQIGPDHRFWVRFSYNRYHVGRGSPWFEVYVP